jgi:hypothetical protein
MQLGSRVVGTNGKYIGKTGTVLDYLKEERSILVGFDDGSKGKFVLQDLVTIDDMTGREFEEGSKVYISAINKVGLIVKELKEGKFGIKFKDGTTALVELKPEVDFIAL